MTDEQREINRRVALVLGGTKITFYPSEGWYWNPPGAEVFYPMPNFCTDPAAADLVRKEIERRGWEWLLCRQKNEYQCVVRALWDANRGITLWEVAERSDESSYMALCLAFLAACEANAEGGGEG